MKVISNRIIMTKYNKYNIPIYKKNDNITFKKYDNLLHEIAFKFDLSYTGRNFINIINISSPPKGIYINKKYVYFWRYLQYDLGIKISSTGYPDKGMLNIEDIIEEDLKEFEYY